MKYPKQRIRIFLQYYILTHLEFSISSPKDGEINFMGSLEGFLHAGPLCTKFLFVLLGRKMPSRTVIVKSKLQTYQVFFSLAHISAYLVKNRIFKTSKYFGQGIEDCYMVEWHGINNADQSKCIKFGCIFITDMEHPYSSSLKFTTLTINYLFCNPNSNSKKSWGHFRSKFCSKYFQKFQIFFSL